MTDAQIIANFEAAQAEHIAASKAYATRNVGSMELLVLAETRRRDPELALRIAQPTNEAA